MVGSGSIFVSVDLGTNGIKVALLDESVQFLGLEYSETSLCHLPSGEVIQDPDILLETALESVSHLLEKTGIDKSRVVCLSFTGQMGGIIGIDEDFNNITGYDSALDGRSGEKYQSIQKEFQEELYSISSGYPIQIAKILWWKEKNREIYNSVKKFIPLVSYVVGKCCGHDSNQAYCDYTHLSFSGCHSVETMSWSEDLCKMYGLDMEKLPRILNPQEVVGKLNREFSCISGLPEGLPLIAGCGDQAACLLGAGIVNEGQLVNVAGSNSVIFTCSDKFISDPNHKVVYMNSVFKDCFYPFTVVNGGGINLRWFRDTFFEDLKGKDIYYEFDKEIENLKWEEKPLFFIPHLSGRICPSMPNMGGAWVGLKYNHGKMHQYKSILESLAYECRFGLECFNSLFPKRKYDFVSVIGGGAKSDLWNQIKADITGIPFRKVSCRELGLFGAGMLAAYANGNIKDLKKYALDSVKFDKEYQVNNQNQVNYDKLYKKYKKIMNLIQSYYDSEENNEK